jgi:ubiquinone/menaquinone biosynthesis C-methylase UbiE
MRARKHERPFNKVQSSYDTIAAEYAKRIYDELKDKPMDRQLLDRFANRVRERGQVCDLGCGPAQIARYLHDRGVDVFGLDLSAAMLVQACRLNPDINFVQGSMLSLGIGSNSLAGIAAFYSIIHIPRGQVITALSEMKRVLRPGGYLLLTFHLGTKTIHEEELWGYAVEFDATLFTTEEMTDYLQTAGMEVEEAIERDPYPEVEYPSRRGYIFCNKRA